MINSEAQEPTKRDILARGYFLCCSTIRAFIRGDDEWFARQQLAVSFTTAEAANMSLNSLRAMQQISDSAMSIRAERALYELTEQHSKARREKRCFLTPASVPVTDWKLGDASR